MFILGIYYGHNSTATLLKNGKVIASVSEERFTGKKNFTGLPKQAIDFVLKTAGISSKDLTSVTICATHSVPVHSFSNARDDTLVNLFVIFYFLVNHIRKAWGAVVFQFPFFRPIGRFIYVFLASIVGRITNAKERKQIATYLNIDPQKVKGYDHHLCHAASSYYASPFNTKKALVFSLDGEGDLNSASVSIFEDNNWQVISKTPRESSLGYLYAYLTIFLGMKANEHEYKVMGLAPYAKDEDVEKLYTGIKDIIWIDPETLIIHSKYNLTDTERFLRARMVKVRFDLLAGVFQKLMEEKITEWIRCAVNKTGIHTVILSGGVFMNVKVNQKVGELKEVKEMFVVPSCGDESSVLGSSYIAYIEELKKENKKAKITPLDTVYWGPEYSNLEIEEFIKKENIAKKYRVSKVSKIEEKVAEILSKGNVVARLNGKMEFGARALGNRSILADPRNIENVKIINDQVKNRDFWMPFAPSILYERQNEYIENPKKFDSFYMMMTFNTTKKGQKELAAAMHQYDYTVRPQLVKKEHNPSYYKLIQEFEKLTGVAGILNTSFNLHGFPIVLGPKEALHAFENSGIRYLALGNYLIEKKFS